MMIATKPNSTHPPACFQRLGEFRIGVRARTPQALVMSATDARASSRKAIPNQGDVAIQTPLSRAVTP